MPAKEMSFIDYAQCTSASAGKRAAWTWNDNIDRANRILVLLIFFGLIAFVAMQSKRTNYRECGPFTIGQSAIGSCDWIGR